MYKTMALYILLMFFQSAVLFISALSSDCKSENNYQSKVLASTLKNPTAMLFSDKFGPNGFLVAEQVGVIWHFNDIISRNVSLNLTNRVVTSEKEMEERGLLGMALDPKFYANGFIYVFYSGKSVQAGFDHDGIIARFSSLEYNIFQKFDPSSEFEILRIPQPGPRQNGGQLFFGPSDGYLYISTGDGGIQNGSRFDKHSLLGKILRLNVGGDALTKPEIYASGFRNPWRCAVDIKWIICGDVGEPNRNEEDIYVIVKGGKYGWFDQIGALCHSLDLCRQMNLPKNFFLPIHSYSHERGQAVVGGIVYRGNKYPRLNGRYIYADYVHGSLHTLQLDSNNDWVKSDDLCIDFSSEQQNLISSAKMHVVGLFENLDDEIYILVNFGNVNSHETGFIYELEPNRWVKSGTIYGKTCDQLLPLISVCLILILSCPVPIS